MIKAIIVGTQATKFVFDKEINIYNNNLSLEIVMSNGNDSILKLLNELDFIEKISSSDVLIFDILTDLVSDRFKDNNFQVIKDFVKNVKIINPDIAIIYNSVRYADKVVFNENKKSDKNIDNILARDTRNWRNDKLDQIENNLLKENLPINMIYYHNESSAYESNVKRGFSDMYYNQQYYLDVFIQFELILVEFYPDEFPKYSKVESLVEALEIAQNKGSEVILVNSRGLLPLWKIKDDVNYSSIMTSLFKLDYIIDGIAQNYIRLIKRLDFHRYNLEEQDGIYYSIQKSRLTSKGISRILFYFQPMTLDGYFEVDSGKRFNPNRFDTLDKSIVKDTVIIRLSDVNLMQGSYFVNTVNYSNYEKNMVDFILNKIEEYGVLHDNVVLYGFSRGGLGALYYGLKLDLPVVSVDPVIDASWFSDNKDSSQYIRGLRTENLLFEINNMDATSTNLKYIIGNSYVRQNTWEAISQLKYDFIKKINLDLPEMTEHGQVVHHVPEQLTLINSILMG